MGIPHLITHLEPYAVDADLTGRSVVIDGPAFAYHVYYLCVAAQEGARNPFQAVPSYQLIGMTALDWLNAVELRQVRIKRIYFDGDLPVAKHQTRTSRLQNYTRQLVNYHASWPQKMPEGDVKSRRPFREANGGGSFSSMTCIPAAPFLVPAVMEAVRRSEAFAGIVRLVPGEADVYCAAHVKEAGGVVLTSDSDLLIHDLGDLGATSFFRDIRFSSEDALASMRCVQYNSRHVSARLGLDGQHGMLKFAFELFKDPRRALSELKERATSEECVKADPQDFEVFTSSYMQPHLSGNDVQLDRILQHLDPRVCEFFLQFYRLWERNFESMSSSSHPNNEALVFEMFLPFLLDCPIRTSAWEASTVTRQFAYGLVNLLLPNDHQLFSVREYRRVQHEGRGREWQVAPLALLKETGECLGDLLVELGRRCALDPNLNLWTMLALYQETDWAIKSSKDAVCSKILDNPTRKKDCSTRTDWDSIQMLMQLHACYYSFRILKQISRSVRETNSGGTDQAWLHKLCLTLNDLQGLERLMDVERLKSWIGGEVATKELHLVREMLGVSASKDSATKVSNRVNKKRRKARTKTADDRPRILTAGFALLQAPRCNLF